MDKQLKQIFLSASIPLVERNPSYYETADVIAIRDCVSSLAKIILPNFRLVWGGHPSITPLISSVLESIDVNIKEHVHLYQSDYFRPTFPVENESFSESLIITDNIGSCDESLALMREKMIVNNDFIAGIFVGGMEGVEEEFELFTQSNPKAMVLPMASTGAAALGIYENGNFDDSLKDDYAYIALFYRLFKDYL
ncbi:MAG: hypothetical protein J7J29_09240 [Psychrobacter sp.]|jgi:hypothetical protein|uniref:Uncharacterized protein n=3 Tax=Psychrobacter namhaensis TaxID=292734 RepID=A0ABW8L7D4_9GAMM|nr:hypothetical protein [Psychrobacter namhaensis]MCD6252489.1 hypothetical protein [Psychrobacter sp.]